MGKAMMGTGESDGEDRAVQAAEKAIANPLLDEISLRGAKGVLINITGGNDLTLFELDEAANRIREEVDPDANIIVGSTLDTDMGGIMRVSVVATGIDALEVNSEMPVPRRSMSEPLRPAVEDSANAEASHSTAESVPQSEEVVARAAPEALDEPSLFEELDVERAAAEDMAEAIFDQPQSDAGDDLPPPAYQPAVAAFEPSRDAVDETPAPETQATPRAPGTPSPEALARLRAAAEKSVPGGGYERREAVPRATDEEERPRFGINSLINRMTGHSDTSSAQPQRQQPQLQQRSQAPADIPQDPQDPDQERIEIPAFLRRQAN